MITLAAFGVDAPTPCPDPLLMRFPTADSVHDSVRSQWSTNDTSQHYVAYPAR